MDKGKYMKRQFFYLTISLLLAIFPTLSNAESQILGEWYSVQRSNGLGSAKTYSEDGTVYVTFGALVDFKYELKGDKLTISFPKADDIIQKVEIKNGNMTLTDAAGNKQELTRMDGNTSIGIIGKWTGDHYTGKKQILDFTAGKTCHLAVPMLSVKGTYQVKGDTLTESFEEKGTKDWKWAIHDNLLMLTETGQGKSEKYIRKGSELPKPVEPDNVPRVPIGKDLLEKEQFLVNANLSGIRSITKDKSVPIKNLIIVGEASALIVELNSKQGAIISFDNKVGLTVPLDVRENEIPKFMNRGGGWQPVSLLDANGRTLWMYPSENLSLSNGAADSMAAGDLNNDGKLEFVVGMNASGGLHVLDMNGKEIWNRTAGNVFSVEVINQDKGVPIILHSDAGNGIVVRNADGDKITTIKNCGDGDFSFLDQSMKSSNPLLVCDNSGLKMVDLNDNVINDLKLPGGGHTPQGTEVYFNGPNNPPFYAFVRTIQATGRKSDLTIFNSSGNLIYHEIFGTSYLAVATLSDKEKRFDTLLVGANSTVWQYRMKISK